MEKFKAVEKAMKTKAYSKEGLSAAAKLDPKDQAKVDCSEFLSSQVDELEQQIETLEAESEQISATMKKGKTQKDKAERIARIEEIIERHKFHQGKLELIRRSLENGGVEADQVMDLADSIKYYVTDGMNDDFMDDDELYDELALDEDEGAFGVPGDNEKGSSQDALSTAEEPTPEPEPAVPQTKAKKVAKESDTAALRKPSTSTKSPLPALATLHTPLSTISNGSNSGPAMKPAQAPARPAEGLKYASAAAAAAASDKNSVGIAPLPPPPGAEKAPSPLPPIQSKTSATSSPASTSVQPVREAESRPSPAPMHSEPEIVITTRPKKGKAKQKEQQAAAAAAAADAAESSKGKSNTSAGRTRLMDNVASLTNGVTNGIKPIEEEPEEESVYHLPASLQDLIESYETIKKRQAHPASEAAIRAMSASRLTCPDISDAECPRTYRPEHPVSTAATACFPKEPLPIFDDPRLYSRIDPDTLFYVFYYKQGSPHQYLAAKALKDQSWRFHKQYQTWFQRHEEPKSITDEFEQGTYRFFDYESTWYASPFLPYYHPSNKL